MPPLPDIDAYPPPPPPSAPTGTPTDFLKGVVGKKVIVHLTSGVDYRGILSLSLLEPSLLMYVCLFTMCRYSLLSRWIYEHRSRAD